jgi:hypothetical protein
MPEFDPEQKRRPLGSLDRALILEDYRSHLTSQTLIRCVFRALMLALVIVGGVVDFRGMGTLKFLRASGIVYAALLMYFVWTTEERNRRELIAQLRKLLVSRRSRDGEELLYDDYIRIKNRSGASFGAILHAEPTVWLLLVGLSLAPHFLPR